MHIFTHPRFSFTFYAEYYTFIHVIIIIFIIFFTRYDEYIRDGQQKYFN